MLKPLNFKTRKILKKALNKSMSHENEWISGQIALSIGATKFEMEMSVPANPVKPTRMLPIFQGMTSSFVEAGASEVEARGDKISCKAGCGACCAQAVPLAEIEAYEIAGLIENLDEPRRSEIKRKFEIACRHFHETGWFERLDNYAELSPKDRSALILEYFYQGVSCPFLENDSCSIHHVRPLACREYLVTSPPENCAAPSAETVRPVDMSIKPSRVLRELARSENLKNLSFVPMIRALEWSGKFPEKMPEKNGVEWMRDFVNGLSKGKLESKTENMQNIDK